MTIQKNKKSFNKDVMIFYRKKGGIHKVLMTFPTFFFIFLKINTRCHFYEEYSYLCLENVRKKIEIETKNKRKKSNKRSSGPKYSLF